MPEKPEMKEVLELQEIPDILEESPGESEECSVPVSGAKLSSGIGDSGDFPAFEEDADTYVAKRDPKWGFRITGGSEFHMPLTVFQVTEESWAEKGGICLGDIILQINGVDATNLTLAQAQEMIQSSEFELGLVAKGMEEDEIVDKEHEVEEKIINLRIPVLKPPEPPKEFNPTPLLDKRFWHPIMCDNPPPPKPEDIEGEELPHHRIIRNIKRFFKEFEDKPEIRHKHIEDMLLALPGAPKEHKV